ncbi:tRNA splicing endonuclease subunit 34 [Leptinotarsa decemlineata]|uniref:tRNA splicing endonuclease subunit 34 n=1 Tax=Leptinotarsa decemlineata TaxID=7539 RepID=UPI003D3089C3
MIDLYYIGGKIFVFNVDHWSELRKKYRIIGEIIGNSSHVPALPLKVSPEEAFLLFQKKIANVLEISTETLKNNRDKEVMKDYEDGLFRAQVEEYKKIRRIQLENIIDKIVENRRKVNDNRSADEILKEELKKSSSMTKDNMIWPIMSAPSNVTKLDSTLLSEDDLSKLTSQLKRNVFRDLWERGYYITQGAKFGGDFLVYFGDPICHHAIFIVKCVDNLKLLSPSELVALGRLGTSVKKKAVLASLVDDKVSYITINWIDS